MLPDTQIFEISEKLRRAKGQNTDEKRIFHRMWSSLPA